MKKKERKFLDFIDNPAFPCIGAKAAAKKEQINFLNVHDLTSGHDDILILSKIYQFLEDWEKDQEVLKTLVVIFDKPLKLTELEFENQLWARLQALHFLDSQIYSWGENISSEVSNPLFSFSLGGKGFFIVGLHSQSSRKARRFEYPTLVFNLHDQFEKLRKEGIFTVIRDKIREKDIKFSGSVNPMMKDFGQASEAIQYSGRKVSKDFGCPFMQTQAAKKRWVTIPPCSGHGFILKKGQLLIVEDKLGQQVADLFCFSLANHKEFLSSGKSIDYNGQLRFSTSNVLYSNESNPMLTIIHDEVGQHDFLYSPCCKNLFRITYKNSNPPLGCYEHLALGLKEFGISQEQITTTFNIFMNVSIDPNTSELKVLPPLSSKGDKIIFQSNMDLIVGLTACSAGQSNNFSFKPIRFKIMN
ncbi:MAG: YqcI/YcgG family protein [Tatlockia sp.]|nr:YqcI/YcgG family protein [Tatlockia sp.]